MILAAFESLAWLLGGLLAGFAAVKLVRKQQDREPR